MVAAFLCGVRVAGQSSGEMGKKRYWDSFQVCSALVFHCPPCFGVTATAFCSVMICALVESPNTRQATCCRSADPRHLPPGETDRPFLAHWFNGWRPISELLKPRSRESSIAGRSPDHHSWSQSHCFDPLNPSPALISMDGLIVLPTVSSPRCEHLCIPWTALIIFQPRCFLLQATLCSSYYR